MAAWSAARDAWWAAEVNIPAAAGASGGRRDYEGSKEIIKATGENKNKLMGVDRREGEEGRERVAGKELGREGKMHMNIYF